MTFIEKAKIVHGNKYDYSLVEYKNAKTKVKIICPIHGIFEQIPDNHTTKKYGCPMCSSSVLSTDEFIKRAKEVHGDRYDYSLVEYKNSDTIIKIICPIHGIFEQKARKHLEGNRCKKCSSRNRALTTEYFIKRSKEVHGNKYDYSLSEYKNAKTKITIICPTHGEFKQIPRNHFLNKQGCPKCKSSHGETKIRKFLTDNNIVFEEQKRFKDCKNKLPLPFDFYIPSLNTVIEFQGEQHYIPTRYCGGKEKFIKTKINDKIKKEFCISNNINFVEIKYNEDIESILTTICTVLYQDQS